MMTTAKDILDKINLDFAEQAPDAMRMLAHAISSADHLDNDRVIRCIIFLANKDMANLNKYIHAAKLDPRDVMLWAEYVGEDKDIKRVRDFDQPFDTVM